MDTYLQGLGRALAGTGVHVMIVRAGFVTSKVTTGPKRAPLATTPDAVAAAVAHGLSRHVAVVCGTGYRGSIAASFLKSRGYTDVSNVLGGMTAWKAAGLPTAA